MYMTCTNIYWETSECYVVFLLTGLLVCHIYRLMFGIFFLLNLVLWGEGSSAAVPFSTLLALLAMW